MIGARREMVPPGSADSLQTRYAFLKFRTELSIEDED
jgi:hypothetical protein